ncbi:MAG: ABC transporter substrate-binding protein [Pseudomonadota bacterium]|nr:ABC transporter substrate-binding protein [Pseudomonadota bacterium]
MTIRTGLMATACVALLAPAALAQSDEPLRLGAFVPVTGAGALGEGSLAAVELAVEEINAGGGILGRSLDLTVADYQTDPAIGVGEANRLIHQVGIDMAVGPTYSQVTLATLPLLSGAQVPSINVSGAASITPDVAPFSFSMLANAETQAQAMVNNAIDVFEAQSFAILSDNGAQAKTAVAEIQRIVEEMGLEVTGVQEYNYSARDLTPQLLALQRGEPDALLLFSSTGDDTANVLLGREQLNWDVPISGSAGASLAAPALEAGGPALYDNVVALANAGFSYCEADGRPERAVAFIEAMQAAHPDSADRYPMSFIASFYDAVYVLKAALEGTDGDLSGPAVAAWIEENAGSFEGVNNGLAASAESHFLIGPSTLRPVLPATQDEYGIQQRAGC